MPEQLTVILPLDTEFNKSKGKKPHKVSYSLNSFLAPLGSTTPRHMSFYYQKRAKELLQNIVDYQLRDVHALSAPYPKKAILRIYAPDKRRRDLDNFSILFKFAMDRIKVSHIPDDDVRYIASCEILYCGVDKENPRVELTIRDITDTDLIDWKQQNNEEQNATE